ncbi:DUF805 domain-containing protein, partial [Cereibacter sphaeroides]
YWYFALFTFLVGGVCNIADRLSGVEVMAFVFGLVSLIPSLAVAFRRLHDAGHSGAWLFLPPLVLLPGMFLMGVAGVGMNENGAVLAMFILGIALMAIAGLTYVMTLVFLVSRPVLGRTEWD